MKADLKAQADLDADLKAQADLRGRAEADLQAQALLTGDPERPVVARLLAGVGGNGAPVHRVFAPRLPGGRVQIKLPRIELSLILFGHRLLGFAVELGGSMEIHSAANE